MGVNSVIVLYVLYQTLATASTDQPVTPLLGDVSPKSKAVSTSTDSFKPTLSSATRKPRDVDGQFSSPLAVTSTTGPLPLPKLSQPLSSTDLILDQSNTQAVSNIGSSLDSKREYSKRSPVLTTSVPFELSLSPLLSIINPITLHTSECLTDRLDKSISYNGLNDELYTYSSCFTDDCKPVLKDNTLRSSELLSSNDPASNLNVQESLISTPKSTLVDRHVLSATHPCCDPPLIPNFVSASSSPMIEILPQSEEPKLYLSEYVLPTCLQEVVTPKEMPMVSNYPDFLSTVLPFPNLSTSTDLFIFDPAISPTNAPYLKHITAENHLFNNFPVSEPILVDNFHPIPSSINMLETYNPCFEPIQSNCQPESSLVASNLPPLLNYNSNTDYSSYTLFEIDPLSRTDNLNPILNKPSMVETFSTKSKIRPRSFMPMNLPYKCPEPVLLESSEAIIPPKVPVFIINTDTIQGGTDPRFARTKICPRTNPREYIKYLFSTINSEPIAVTGTSNILPSKVQASDFVELVTPIAPTVDMIFPTSNVVQNTLILPELTESVPVLSPKSLPIGTDALNNMYNGQDPRYVFPSYPYHMTPINEAYTYLNPDLASKDFPTSSTLSQPEIVSAPVLGSNVYTASSTRPLNITPNNVERASKVFVSDVNNPTTIFLSLPEQSTSFQSTSIPSIIGTDIYCTKDSILLQTPSPTVSCLDITPSSIATTTAKVVSSINNAASKIAKSAISSFSSSLKSMTKINPKSSSVPPKATSTTSNIPSNIISSSVTSSASPLKSTALPSTSSCNINFSPQSSPTYLPSPDLPSHGSISSSPMGLSPVLSTDNMKDLEALKDLVLLSELLKEMIVDL